MRRGRIAAVTRVNVAFRQRNAQRVASRHESAEAVLARSLGGRLRRLCAVRRDEREHRAAQAVLRLIHHAVIILVEPDAPLDGALRIQTKAHTLHTRTAQQRKSGRVDAAVPFAVHWQRAAGHRTGEHVAVRRAHAQHVGAGAHSVKAEPAFRIRRSSFQDVAAAAIHQRDLDASEHGLARIHHTVRVAVHPDAAAHGTQSHDTRTGCGN